MSFLENEKSQPRSEQPVDAKSFENTSHQILRNPIQIDLEQPDRAEPYLMESVTGFKQSKLIAEIVTPDDHMIVIHTQLANLEPVILVVGSRSHQAKMTLEPNEEIDLSDVNSEGKCILSLDETGRRLFVRATDPDTSYKIYTRELEQYKDAQSVD